MSKTRVKFLGCGLVLAFMGTATAAEDVRLIQATRQQDAKAAQALIRQKVNVNARQPDGTTALHWAAYRDDSSLVTLLLAAGANVNAANDLGVTPLMLASQNGSAAVVSKLLEAKADPNLALQTGESPLMAASRTGSMGAVRALLAHGANVNATENTRNQNALMWAVAAHNADIARVLIEGGADIKARTKIWPQLVYWGNRGVTSPPADMAESVREVQQGGFTPLLFAAQQGDLVSLKLLLDSGGDPNDIAPLGTSALIVAAHSGQGAAAKLLLDRGADPNYHAAGYTALHIAVLRDDLDLVKALLAKGANPNPVLVTGTPVRKTSQDYALTINWKGATPIWLAAKFAEPAMVAALGAAGADPNVKAADGTVPLLVAVSSGRGGDRRERYMTESEIAAIPEDEDQKQTLATVQTLAALKADLNAVDKNGDTAVHIAAGRLYNDVVKGLAENGADINVVNKKGLTPLAALLTPRVNPGLVAAGGAVVDTTTTPPPPGAQKTAEFMRQLGAR